MHTRWAYKAGLAVLAVTLNAAGCARESDSARPPDPVPDAAVADEGPGPLDDLVSPSGLGVVLADRYGNHGVLASRSVLMALDRGYTPTQISDAVLRGELRPPGVVATGEHEPDPDSPGAYQAVEIQPPLGTPSDVITDRFEGTVRYRVEPASWSGEPRFVTHAEVDEGLLRLFEARRAAETITDEQFERTHRNKLAEAIRIVMIGLLVDDGYSAEQVINAVVFDEIRCEPAMWWFDWIRAAEELLIREAEAPVGWSVLMDRSVAHYCEIPGEAPELPTQNWLARGGTDVVDTLEGLQPEPGPEPEPEPDPPEPPAPPAPTDPSDLAGLAPGTYLGTIEVEGQEWWSEGHRENANEVRVVIHPDGSARGEAFLDYTIHIPQTGGECQRRFQTHWIGDGERRTGADGTATEISFRGRREVAIPTNTCAPWPYDGVDESTLLFRIWIEDGRLVGRIFDGGPFVLHGPTR